MNKKTLALVAIVVLLGLLVYFRIQLENNGNAIVIPSTITPTETVVATPTPTPTKELVTYEGTTPKGYTHFIEMSPKINGQQGYVAFPKTSEKENPPAVVIYYHGSTQNITTNFNDQVMKNMRAYGAYFTERNIAFLASNQHGDNWGSKTAVEDSRSLISWVKKNYSASLKVYVLGFSMGGMPALKHVILYPKEVDRIALLAPAQQVKTYSTTQIKYFRDVPLKVWHGTADTNVPYWVTEELVSYFKKNNTPITVVTLKGKIHWDVDTEYMNDVFRWFTNTN